MEEEFGLCTNSSSLRRFATAIIYRLAALALKGLSQAQESILAKVVWG